MNKDNSAPKYSTVEVIIEKNGRQYTSYYRKTTPIGRDIKGYVLILHGILSSSATMIGIMEYLSGKGYVCIAPDLLAHGYTRVSAIVPSDYKIPFVAELVHLTIENEGWNKLSYYLLGHSAGGIVAQVYADMYTSEIEKLILSSTSCKLLKSRDWNYGLSEKAVVAFAKLAVDPNYIQDFNVNLLTENCDSNKIAVLEKTKAIIAAQANREGISYFIEQNINLDLREVLIRLRIPIMVLIGDRDALFSVEEAEWIRNNVQDGYLYIFKGKNHSPFITDYKRYNRIVYDYISDELDKCELFVTIPVPIETPNTRPNNGGKVRPPLVV